MFCSDMFLDVVLSFEGSTTEGTLVGSSGLMYGFLVTSQVGEATDPVELSAAYHTT